MSDTTIFSSIISGDIPATKIYEDDTVLAFLDIQPLQPGHTLVIPKTPSIDARAADPDTFAAVMRVAQQIATALTNSLECDGVNLIMNCGAAAGQEVFHTHVHVVPRYADDGVFESPLRGEYADGEPEQVAAAIIQAL